MKSKLRGTWQFDEHVAINFVDHIRRSIPYYNELQDEVVNILEYTLPANATVIDIGGATGETISRINKRMSDRDVNFIYIDNSVHMLKTANDYLFDIKNVTFHNSSIELMELPKSDAIIMLYTLQFVPIVHRAGVINKVFNALNDNGVFILSDKVISGGIILENLFNKLLYDLKRSNGFTDTEIINKQLQIENVLVPLSTEANIALLRDAGFKTYDIFFKANNFVGFLSIK